MSADRNLLFGILAVQLDFVSKDALIDAMNAWLLDKARPLGVVLRDRGALDADTLALLDALVAKHLAQHGDDPKRSLAALSSVEPALRQGLATITDAGVQQSLAAVTVPPRGHGTTAGSGTLLHPASAAPAARPAAAPTGLRYRIVRPHAKGGLGEVFVAEDTELGRHVALKEIQGRYADDGTSRSRFVLEAEITGGLEHPGIVPVYGLGTYGDGRPFYAMRFIQGDNLQEAIQRFHAANGPISGRRADAGRHLQFRDLLRRFIDVCNAVAYAHSRGVLHRDLKPGNVMLGKYGETLVVDWGLAKAMGRSDPAAGGDPTLVPRSGKDSSMATAAGQALGTPAYMSPEQADGRLDELGPATDVYALGATLYEVLVGRPAFHGLPVADVLCRVVSGEVPPPRAVQPAAPAALEAVCRKAMALRPADRYATATALARDVERWLADEPVAAYPEPFGARARRWVRKRARLVTGAAAALAIGLVAVGALAWQREQARAAIAAKEADTARERDAKEAARAAAVAANEQAQRRLTQVERANEILGSVFKDLDPKAAEKEGKPLQAVLGERLDQATAAIEGEAIGDALTVARMQMTLGESQVNLGYSEKAIRLFAAARATFTAQLGPDHPDTLQSLHDLAVGYQAAGRHGDALPLLEEALRLRKAKLGPDHRDTFASLNDLAVGYQAVGRLSDALPLLEEVLRLRKAKLGPDHPDTIRSLNHLAVGYHAVGRLGDALPLYEEALRLRRAKLGPDHPHTLTNMSHLGRGYHDAGRLGDALPLYEEALRLRRAKLGPDHPDTLWSLAYLADGYRAAGRLDDALPLHEEALRLRKARLGPDHPDTLASLNNLAIAYRAAGRAGDALPLSEETLRLTSARLGPDHPDTLTSMNNLGKGYQASGRLAEALPLLEKTLKLRKARLGPDHPDTLVSLNDLAVGYRAAGRVGDALPLHEEALQRQKAKLGPDHPSTLVSMAGLASGYRDVGRLGDALPLFDQAARGIEKRQYRHQHAGPIVADAARCLEALRRFDAAEEWRRKWLAVVRERSGPESPAYAAALEPLGHNLLRQQKWTDAESTLRESLEIRAKREPDAWTTFNTRSLLGDSLIGQQNLADAEPLLLAGYGGLKQRAATIPKRDTSRLSEAAERLVRLYAALGKPDEAARYLDEMWAWADAPPAAK